MHSGSMCLILEKQPNNNRSIESQLMNHFLSDNINLDLLNSVDSIPLAENFRDVTCDFAKQYKRILTCSR